MAKKALKQNISICEIQKMIHQWKARGISDSACLKLLDLYLGLPPYMTAEGIYPLRNFYQISQSLKTTHTTILLENIRKCGTFGLVWDENHSKLLGFYSPLWQQVQKKGTAQNTDSVAGSATTVASPATTAANLATADNNILYNINNNIKFVQLLATCVIIKYNATYIEKKRTKTFLKFENRSSIFLYIHNPIGNPTHDILATASLNQLTVFRLLTFSKSC